MTETFFDPHRLTVRASLNKLRLVASPVLPIAHELVGQQAHALLGQGAVAALTRARAVEAGLDEYGALGDAPLLGAMAAWAEGEEPGPRAVADDVAAELGRRLATLLAVLHRGDGVSRAARVEWDEAIWEHWGCVRRVWVGGGMAAGAFGARIVRHAATELAHLGIYGLALEQAPAAAAMPLVGAARCLPPGQAGGLVCDFGHTTAKAAWADCADGTLTALHLLPPAPVPWPPGPPAPSTDLATLADAVFQFIVARLREAWRALETRGLAVGEEVVISVASYVNEDANQTLEPVGGLYALAGSVAWPLGGRLAAALSVAAGRAVRVRLVHDGTAAARSLAGERHAAVILLGTALGVGFPTPHVDGLIPLNGWPLITTISQT